MFLSAVSLLLLGKAGAFDLNEREIKAWKKIQPSIVYLTDGSSISGTATLIDKEGLFLADRSAFTGTKAEGRATDGHTVHFVLLATDDPTQFVLLKAENWNTSDGTPVSLAETDSQQQRQPIPLIAITTNGPVRAEKVGSSYGIVVPSRRFMPLSEIRLENTQASLGGALLFNLDGQLVGALNATLETPAGQSNFQARSVQNQSVGGGAGFGTRGGSGAGGGGGRGDSAGSFEKLQNNQYGPGLMATAYTVGPRILQRVVDGFRSPSHEVLHPSIGIVCRNAIPMGALIDSVKPGSTADKAGLRKGDIITKMSNQSVQNQFDFARIMLDQEVGTNLRMWVQHENGLIQMIDVPVGK